MTQPTGSVTRPFCALVGSLVLTVFPGLTMADDTDIYAANNPGAGSMPLVMFTLDYRPNLGSTACNGDECDGLIAEGLLPATGPYTFFDVLRASLRKVFEPLSGVSVGLMLTHDNKNNCAGPMKTGCSNGGYIAMGFAPFLPGDSNGAKARFHGIMDALPTPQGHLSHPFQGKELYFEFFRYLTGQSIYNGHNGYTDYAGNPALNLNVEFPAISWDATIEHPSDKRYISPLTSASSCTKLFAVNTMFFVASQDADSDSAIAKPRALGGMDGTKDEFAEVIEYLNDADLADGSFGSVAELPGKQNVTSFFLVDPSKINTTTIEYATAGNTDQPLPMSSDPDELLLTLQQIFEQIVSVSTTFVAASVPVNVFNRGETLDNAYIALFQADADAKPGWTGNVKKLKIHGLDDPSGNAYLVDANKQSAVATDGRIRTDALTFWTSPGALPPADPETGEVAGRDGRSVARGGAGQKIPGFIAGSPGATNGADGGRTIFYDDGTALAPLNATSGVASALATDLGAASTSEAEALLRFARGLDIDDVDGDSVTDEARRWIFSDALHSRPMPVNYGARDGYTHDNPAIFIAVASNDGLLHFLRNTRTDGTESGQETWAFMPRAVMDKLKTLRANSPGVKHPYMVDGSPVVYIEDANQNGTVESGEKAYLYFGLRRGGKKYYALDISDPLNPALLWTIGKGGDFAELGWTFSTPRVGHVDTGGGKRAVLVFAGGYDMNKDAHTAGTDDGEGAAIFVVDASSGELIWKAIRGVGAGSDTVFLHPELTDSIPSAVSLVDTDGNGLSDRLVVGDTGGRVWRADFGGTDTSKWKLTLLANIGRHSTDGADRRFFHRPDIILGKDEQGAFDGVVIGSGNRADPLDKGSAVANYVYMIKDRNVAVGSATDSVLEHGQLGDVTDNCLQSGSLECSVDLDSGWQMALQAHGEKSLATPFTIGGTIYFTSYVPAGIALDTTSCEPAEGSGRLYAVSLADGRAVQNYDTTNEELTIEDRYTDLNSGGIPAEIVSIPPDRILRPDLVIDKINSSTRWRTFWYENEAEE